jgi:drug/metabolite transporter (DMT)-like permease
MLSLRFLRSVPAGTLTCVNNFACCFLLLPFVIGELALTRAQCLTLVVMGVVQLGIPYWLFSRALEKIPVHEAALIVLIEPVLNPLWVALTVGEIPAPPTMIGGALILAALAVRYGWGLAASAQVAANERS